MKRKLIRFFTGLTLFTLFLGGLSWILDEILPDQKVDLKSFKLYADYKIQDNMSAKTKKHTISGDARPNKQESFG